MRGMFRRQQRVCTRKGREIKIMKLTNLLPINDLEEANWIKGAIKKPGALT